MNTLFCIEKFIVSILEKVLSILVAILVIDVVWQVITRYILNNPSSWTTEVATILLIWISLLGTALAFQKKGHLGFDYIVEHLSPKYKNICEYIVLGIIAFFVIFILIGGGSRLVYLVLLTKQMSPVLGFKIGYAYTVIPISGILMILFLIKMLIEKIYFDIDTKNINKENK